MSKPPQSAQHRRARPRVVGFCGSFRRPSRARSLVELVCAELTARFEVEAAVLDLLDAGPSLGASYDRAGLDSTASLLLESIEQADALVIGAPVYQGSYPGLFKHVFDLVNLASLKGRPVLLTAVGGGLRHSLMIEHQLRPLFGFFEARTMPTTVYAGASEFVGNQLAGDVSLARIADATEQLAGCLLPLATDVA